MLSVKILSLQYPERYVVRRLVAAVQHELQVKSRPLDLVITEVADPAEIGRYALVLILPTLVVNEKVVCSGRFPGKEEIKQWLLEAAEEEEHNKISLP